MSTSKIIFIVLILISTFQSSVQATTSFSSLQAKESTHVIPTMQESNTHLLSFVAQQNKKRGVELVWTINKPFPFAYYQVQSSLDGKSWYDKEKIEISDPKKIHYTSLDRSTSRYPNNQTIFYRLVMVDNTETQYFSDICPVRLQSKAKAELQVFRNPENGVFQINLPIIPQGQCEVLIVDTDGDIVHRQMLKDTTPIIDLQGLDTGNYWLSMMTPQKAITQKIILME